MRGEALDVDFIDDQLLEPEIWRLNPLPVEGVVDDDGLRNDGGVVAMILDSLAGSRLRVVGKQQIVDVPKLSSHGFRVRIEEQFGVIESKAPLGTVLPSNLVAVPLSSVDAIHVRVPDQLVALLETDDVRGIAVRFIKQEKEDLRRVLGVEREVDAGRR